MIHATFQSNLRIQSYTLEGKFVSTCNRIRETRTGRRQLESAICGNHTTFYREICSTESILKYTHIIDILIRMKCLVTIHTQYTTYFDEEIPALLRSPPARLLAGGVGVERRGRGAVPHPRRRLRLRRPPLRGLRGRPQVRGGHGGRQARSRGRAAVGRRIGVEHLAQLWR